MDDYRKTEYMKSQLPYAEIYITNVCNYSCVNCQSLNNFSFKGHQKWQDYQEEYLALSNLIDINTIQIIGGEPTLNPDFEAWVNGISNLWPTSKLEIATNGSRLDKLTKEIYQILSRNNGTLWITCHDIELYNELLGFSKQFLDTVVASYVPNDTNSNNWQVTYASVRSDSWPECTNIDQFVNLPYDIKNLIIEQFKNSKTAELKTTSKMFVDKNGVKVRLDWSQSFVPGILEVVDNYQLKIKYDSDPMQAHDICYFKSCHQINKGKLYKCPLVSILPDFLNQFKFNISDRDQSVARAYVPMDSTCSIPQVTEFINNIQQPIPQCKFCPVAYTKSTFVGTEKKIKIIPV
jgi:organic radical activating enzyme